MKKHNITISKVITISNESKDQKQINFFNKLITEMKVLAKEKMKNGKSYEMHRNQDTDFYFELTVKTGNFASKLFKNEPFDVNLVGRHGVTRTMNSDIHSKFINIKSFDGESKAVIDLEFSIKLELISNFGSILVLKDIPQIENPSKLDLMHLQTFVLDLDNKEYSIVYLNK